MPTGTATGTATLPALVASGYTTYSVVAYATGAATLPALVAVGTTNTNAIPPGALPQTPTPVSNLSTLIGDDPGFNRLYDNVLAMVPAVGFPLVRVAAWNTIEDFYLRSTAKRAVNYWTMGIGVQQLDFNPYSEEWLVAWVLDVWGITFPMVIPPAVLIDQSPPVAVRTGGVLLALKPVSSESFCDPLLFQQWFETILAGTLYRLYSMPTKPFTSMQLAVPQAKLYMSGVARARAIAQNAYTNTGGRWRYPYFSTGRRKQ